MNCKKNCPDWINPYELTGTKAESQSTSTTTARLAAGKTDRFSGIDGAVAVPKYLSTSSWLHPNSHNLSCFDEGRKL